MPANHTEVEKCLWDAADELRANSKLKSSEYSVPVLGLMFLRYADHKFSEAEKKFAAGGSGRRKIGKTDYQAQGVLYISEKARFRSLLDLPEDADIGNAISEAMKAIEASALAVCFRCRRNWEVIKNADGREQAVGFLQKSGASGISRPAESSFR